MMFLASPKSGSVAFSIGALSSQNYRPLAALCAMAHSLHVSQWSVTVCLAVFYAFVFCAPAADGQDLKFPAVASISSIELGLKISMSPSGISSSFSPTFEDFRA